MSDNNKAKKQAPVIVLREEPSNLGRYLLLFLPAIVVSVILHVGLVIAFVVVAWMQREKEAPPLETAKVTDTVTADPVEDKKNETFLVTDTDPAAVEFDTDIQYNNKRIEDVSVPGAVDPNERIGILGGDEKMSPFNIPAPGGFSSKGQGGALEVLDMKGNSSAVGQIGGYGPRGLPLDKNFGGRSGSTRETSLREGGGTTESEVAVAEGLKWLIRQQLSDGRWSGKTGPDGDVAATALGLLPFLAAGKTHLGKDKNPYDKNIYAGLKYLMNSQNPKTGFFGGRMYSHGMATIAMCEAYGLSQDPQLRKYAQGGINLIVATQHAGNGGWSYGPDKDSPHRDMSLSGWQIMALKSGQMAGLIVPTIAIERSKKFLNECESNNGYGYTPGSGGTARMTAVGLLCRQYMENWGPSNPKMIMAVEKYIKPNRPDRTDVYYYYYATQVMHHMGGEGWRDWNEQMRDTLVKRQDVSKGANRGSWAPTAMDAGGHINDRLVATSLNLLTLEVYYRYLPLYYRDAGYSKDRAVKMAL